MAAVAHTYVQTAAAKFESPSPRDKAFQQSTYTADLARALRSFRDSKPEAFQSKTGLSAADKNTLQIAQFTHSSGTLVLRAEPIAYWAGRYNSTRDRLCAVDPEICERTRDIYIFAELRRTCLSRPAKISFLAFESTYKSMVAQGTFLSQCKADPNDCVQD